MFSINTTWIWIVGLWLWERQWWWRQRWRNREILSGGWDGVTQGSRRDPQIMTNGQWVIMMMMIVMIMTIMMMLSSKSWYPNCDQWPMGHDHDDGHHDRESRDAQLMTGQWIMIKKPNLWLTNDLAANGIVCCNGHRWMQEKIHPPKVCEIELEMFRTNKWQMTG